MRNANSQIVGRFIFDNAQAAWKDKRIAAAKEAPSEFAEAAMGFGAVAAFAVAFWFLLQYGL
jgi:hypothetical protein